MRSIRAACAIAIAAVAPASATLVPAGQALGRPDVGVIEVGRFGDFVAVAGDSMANVRLLEAPQAVIKGGKRIAKD